MQVSDASLPHLVVFCKAPSAIHDIFPSEHGDYVWDQPARNLQVVCWLLDRRHHYHGVSAHL